MVWVFRGLDAPRRVYERFLSPDTDAFALGLWMDFDYRHWGAKCISIPG